MKYILGLAFVLILIACGRNLSDVNEINVQEITFNYPVDSLVFRIAQDSTVTSPEPFYSPKESVTFELIYPRFNNISIHKYTGVITLDRIRNVNVYNTQIIVRTATNWTEFHGRMRIIAK